MKYSTFRQKLWEQVKKLVLPELDVLLAGSSLRAEFAKNNHSFIHFWLKADDSKPLKQRNIWGIHFAVDFPKWMRDMELETAECEFRPKIEEECRGIVSEEKKNQAIHKKVQAKRSKIRESFFGRYDGRTPKRTNEEVQFVLQYWFEHHGHHSQNQKNIRRYLYHLMKDDSDCFLANESKGHKHITRWIAMNSIPCPNVELLVEQEHELVCQLAEKLKIMILRLGAAIKHLLTHLDSRGNLQDSADDEIKTSVESSLCQLLGKDELLRRARQLWAPVVGDISPQPEPDASFQELYMAAPSRLREDFCHAIVFDKKP